MIQTITHPDYDLRIEDWHKWRITYEGGRRFISQYLKQLSKREKPEDFSDRLAVTYNPAFAKCAINEVKDSINQRMSDVIRTGGSKSYQDAVLGSDGGVDLLGSSMNYFMGTKILPELITMERVGIYIDMPPVNGPSLADNQDLKPYIYIYKVENIRAWIVDDEHNPNEFLAILLEEQVYEYDKDFNFPITTTTRFRRVWKNEIGEVLVAFYNNEGKQIDANGNETTEPFVLKINKVPFVLANISDSLLTDIADYQIALLNLASTDMGYALKANFPFYTENYDPRANAPHLRTSGLDKGGEVSDASAGKTEEVRVGATAGRKWPKGLERPGFIHPSSEPLTASMNKQEQLKREIRQILNLTIANLQGPKMASADSKKQDSQSLETGLYYIGLALQNAESKIAEFWAMYEGTKEVATVNYPTNYSLKTDADRQQEADALEKKMVIIPSKTFQKTIAKRIASVMLGNKTNKEVLESIYNEIETAVVISSDPDVIAKDHENGLVGTELASEIRGYPPGEVEKAKKDHTERLLRIAEAQTMGAANAAARGNPDASQNPAQDARAEKTLSRDTTQDGVVTDKTRGKGANNRTQ